MMFEQNRNDVGVCVCARTRARSRNDVTVNISRPIASAHHIQSPGGEREREGLAAREKTVTFLNVHKYDFRVLVTTLHAITHFNHAGARALV